MRDELYSANNVLSHRPEHTGSHRAASEMLARFFWERREKNLYIILLIGDSNKSSRRGN